MGDIGRDFEKKWCKLTGSKPTIASGAFWFSKEDTICDRFLYQCKATNANGYVLKYTDLKQLIKHSNKKGLDWAFVISFKKYDKIYVIVDAYTVNSSKEVCYIQAEKSKKIRLDLLEELWIDDIQLGIEMKEIDCVVMNFLDFKKFLEENNG